MFNLNLVKDDKNLTTSTDSQATDKISQFKRGKIDAYNDWYLIDNNPYYRIFGVIVATIEASKSTTSAIFTDNQERNVQIMVYVQTPRLDNKSSLSLLNMYNPTYLDNAMVNKIFGVNKLVDAKVADRLLNGLHYEQNDEYISTVVDHLKFIGVPEQQANKLLSFELKNEL